MALWKCRAGSVIRRDTFPPLGRCMRRHMRGFVCMAGAPIANAGSFSRGPQGPRITSAGPARPNQEHTVHFAQRQRRKHAPDCFQFNSPEDIRRGLYAEATRTPSRTHGGRTRLHDYDEQQIWIHELDVAQMYVDHQWPVDLWEHRNQAIRDSVGCPYRWPRRNMGLGTNAFRPQDAILQNLLVDVWNHHMRRDENDACGAIPRTKEEWPILSDEQIWRESHMPRVDKVPDANQMSRIWNYVPPRAGRSRFQESRHQASQSSG